MKKKKCTKCTKKKKIKYFYKNKKSLFGVSSVCKICANTIRKKYKFTKAGISITIFNTQKRNSKSRNHPMPSYTRLELYEWMCKQSNFDSLFIAWKKSKYKTNLKPSIDRLNDYLPYTFDNIQLVTCEVNLIKGHTDQITGKNNKQGKPVIQYDKTNNIVGYFHSMIEAERQTGISNQSISNCCNKNKIGNKSAGGFIWKYKSKRTNHETN